MRRGDVIRFDIPPRPGEHAREQHGERPAIVIQENTSAANLATVVIVPVTSVMTALRFAGAVRLSPTRTNGLTAESVALVHQVRAIDKSKSQGIAGRLSSPELQAVEDSLRSLLAL